MGKKKEANKAAKDARDIAVRALLNKLPGNWPIIADLGMHIMGTDTDKALAKGKDYLGNVFLPEWNFNGIGTLERGFGYQIKISEAINEFNLCNP